MDRLLLRAVDQPDHTCWSHLELQDAAAADDDDGDDDDVTGLTLV